MSSTIQFRPAHRASTRTVSALERLTRTYAARHHDHEAPLVGCYLCLHNTPRRPQRVLASAA